MHSLLSHYPYPHPHQSSACVIADDVTPSLTHHHHSQSIVYMGVRSPWCTFHGLDHFMMTFTHHYRNTQSSSTALKILSVPCLSFFFFSFLNKRRKTRNGICSNCGLGISTGHWTEYHWKQGFYKNNTSAWYLTPAGLDSSPNYVAMKYNNMKHMDLRNVLHISKHIPKYHSN